MTVEELKVVVSAQTSGFNKQMSSVKKTINSTTASTASASSGFATMAGKIAKIGATVGVAVVALKAVSSAMNSCIEAGSNLAEVQNVVDVTFTSMSDSVTAFAQDAITSYGLSETMAKKYVGTLGAMASSFGFNEKQAYGMSTALTGLAGDVASFYNISQDEAFTKLKSVFTGETESLKELGVVMTQSALDEYALANGFGKTTSSMTEAEKVALRYQFVLSNLSNASGDFARTSGSWANQTRVLSLQWEQLKANLGQGFIDALAPVLQGINALVAKLVVASQYIKAFMQAIFGDNSGSSSALTTTADTVTSAMGAGADASKSINANLTNASKKATAIKDTFKGLAGIDELNTLSKENADSGTSTSSGSSGSGSTGSVNLDDMLGTSDGGSKTSSAIDKIQAKVNSFVEKCKTLFTPFYNNYIKPIGESISGMLTSISTAVSGVITTIVSVVGGIWNLIKPYVEGVISGITENVKGIFDIIKGVIDLVVALFSGDSEGLKDAITTICTGIKEYIDGFLTIIYNLIGTIIAGIIGIITGVLETVTTVSQNIWEAISGVFSPAVEWFKDVFSKAVEAIKTAFSVVGEFFAGVWSTIKEAFSDVKTWFSTLFSGAYDNIKKAFENVKTFFTDVWGKIKDAFDGVKKWFSTLFSGAYDKVKDAFKNVKSAFNTVWSNIKAPFNNVKTWFSTCFSNAYKGVTGAFTNIKTFFSGIWDKIKGCFKNIGTKAGDAVGGAFKSTINSIISTIESTLNKAVGFINSAINIINKIPKVNVSKLSEFSFPRLATGGVTTGSTIANIGEAGKEAVIPLERNTGWMSTLATQLVDKMGSAGSNQPLEITLNVGGTTFGKACIESINKAQAQSGAILLNI